ncbi:alcohol dehydrogenase [Novosphingobium colocasiae]|uniref:alcohol dehydrogenase n=1 Tax=Novosphingobium colocasiae TaxID=1256513 RepID=A0A918PD26_9SPHN|nr:alcohol dehydrogenase [Novosphingobium colocasiae]GGY98166.1 NAD-dependent alcohol dehydrogenase [Novosphingobium colocasiae]
MKAWMVTAAKAPLEQRELETPVPQGTEVLVETAYCGVCHSDLHFWKGEYNMGGGKIMKLADRGVKLPQAPGHEIAGRVVAKGPDATGVEVGDMRVVYPWLGCGDCYYCNNGLDNWCRTPKGIGVVRSGGFGSHVMVPHARYLADPGKVDPALAATYACSGLTIYSSLKKIMPLDPDRPILLIGAGGLGLMAIEMLKALDHHQIISVDIDADKRRVAEERGATVTFDGRADDLVDQIAAYCGKVPAVLDFVNNDKTAAAGLACLDKGGTLVLVGVAGGELAISLATMIFMGWRIEGNLTGTPGDLHEVLALANSGKLAPTPIECRHIDEANAAMTDLKEGKVTGRAVLEWS